MTMTTPRPLGRVGLLAGVSAAVLSFAGAPANAATYSVLNPYVPTQSSYDTLKIRRLITFGDSYSDPKFSTDKNWSEWLVSQGGISWYSTLAKEGATACNCVTNGVLNTFQQQLNRWFNANPTYQYRDLTVVYFGQNDINRLPDLTKAKANYESGIDQLIADGALGNKRRMLLTMVHNIARNPSHQARAANNTTIWNRHVAQVANERKDVIAVDLFTAFNKVYANPGRYGFVNVTTANATRSRTDYLYYDGNHFGQKGQLLISQVFKHYLTRGWDWANTLQTGSQTVARLNADIEAGRVFRTSFADEQDPALAIVPFGALAVTDQTASWDAPVWARDGGTNLTEQPVDQAPDGGVGVKYKLDDSTDLAFLVAEYDDVSTGDNGFGDQENRTLSRSTGLVLGHKLGGLELTTSFLYSDDRHSRSSHDDFVDETNHADFGGNTMRLGQRFSYGIAASGVTWTPWVELSWQRQDVDEFTIADPYVSDVTYDAGAVEETSLGLGIAGSSDAIPVGEQGSLRLFGGIGYTHSLSMDDYQVAISEAAVANYTQQETVQRESIRSVNLNFGATWEASSSLALSAAYRMDTPVQDGSVYQTQHAITAGLKFRF
jgi:phospholipase/lecithinase/hemolysin